MSATKNWGLWYWESDGGAGRILYKVEHAGPTRIILESSDGKLFAVNADEVDLISEEEALVFKLEGL